MDYKDFEDELRRMPGILSEMGEDLMSMYKSALKLEQKNTELREQNMELRRLVYQLMDEHKKLAFELRNVYLG